MKLSAQRRPSLLLTQLLGSGPQGTKERCQVPGPTRDLLAHCYGSGRGGTGVLSGPEADGAAARLVSPTELQRNGHQSQGILLKFFAVTSILGILSGQRGWPCVPVGAGSSQGSEGVLEEVSWVGTPWAEMCGETMNNEPGIQHSSRKSPGRQKKRASLQYI